MTQVTFRALPTWPYPATKSRRGRNTFKAPWSNTLKLLGNEIRFLDGKNVVLGAGFREQDLRIDGMPRTNAKVPGHPGIEISFDSRHGRLVYATDACEWWEHNVRSIALGLESLRAVDRYGITRRGEQYAGWKQLGSGSSADIVPAYDRGAELVRKHGSIAKALHATHPDHGGQRDDFDAVLAYRAGRP